MLFAALSAAGPRGVEVTHRPPTGLEEAYAARRVALLVGIDTYVDPALGNLQYAAKDATNMASVLSDGDVGAYDVVSLVSGRVDRDRFWAAFDAVASTVQRDDTVVIYVAAHGTLHLGSEGTELYLLPSDGWVADPQGSAIRVAEVLDRVEALSARRKVVVLDTCHAGTGRSVVSPDTKRKLDGARGAVPAPPAASVSAFSAHLYAAHVNQPAIEDPTLENGVFTHFLIEGLRGAADGDGDGLIEVMEAHDWARDRTLEYTGGSQVPWAETVAVGREAVFLAGNPVARRAAEEGLLAGLERLAEGAVLTVDGIPRGPGPVQPGVRHLQVQRGDDVWLDRHVLVEAGRELDVAGLVTDRQARVEFAGELALSTDARWLGAAGGAMSGWYLPRDAGGSRWSVGVNARVAAPGQEPSPIAGLVGFNLGWFAGPQGFQVGPTAGAGWAWRVTPGIDEGSPLIAGGARVRVGTARFFGVTDLGVPMFAALGAPVASPWVGLGLGWSVGGGAGLAFGSAR